ncbi:MotA/TolQ/ExbB proton channel family protein [Campylobacter sp. RM16192]|uniref:MotA/TolQ/ExbB proton channel family protein n=1 Tax=Campylobacter sp. RM16192 TaxID=1660080 RepID=UPI0014520A0D|nr:MotA/TolQ/ExbB proton channel family protein [Campylobacter sp. RM16192]QCD52187.1 TonB system transport protein ExbB [Campylobacter sp. RM16192]
MYEYLQTGGIFMWPIFFLCILAVAVLLEKAFYFTFIEIDSTSNFKMKLSNLILEGDTKKIRDFCKNYKNSLAKTTIMVLDNIENLNSTSKTQIEYIIEEAVTVELSNLEKRSWILGLCASASPQLGLLGTVVGMIKAFEGLSSSINAPLVAIGISEALYTTAAGLIVGIPCLVFHLMINKKIDFILNDLNRLISLFGRCCERKCCEVCPS